MRRMSLVLPILLSLLCCSRPREIPRTKPEEPAPPAPLYGSHPLALLQGGEQPLWFELGEQGPALIASPEEAPLRPFAPWPLALRVAGTLGLEDRIILGINREGFLVFAPQADDEDSIALYRVDNNALWQDYSVASLFVFDSKPAALLYRDDYFIDRSAPPPSPRVWGLDHSAGMQGLFVEAFEDLPPEDGWDLEDLRQGPDDRWHYRAILKSGRLQGMGYFSAGDLALPAEPSTQAALQNASRPRPRDQAPEPLRQVLEAALAPEEGHSGVIALVASPEFQSARNYAAPRAFEDIQGDIRLYNGYYLRNSRGAIALVVGPEGQGAIGVLRDDELMLREFALPSLPRGFVYTGAALFHRPFGGGPDRGAPGSVIALGIWEEQENWNVGAAGFVLSPVHTFPEQ